MLLNLHHYTKSVNVDCYRHPWSRPTEQSF